MKKATDLQILNSYKRIGSVWKTAKELNMCGQSVHERLHKLNAINSMNLLSDADKLKIEKIYRAGFRNGDGVLNLLSLQIGRTKHFICRYARTQGLTSLKRKANRELIEKMSICAKENIKINGHPRGALGMKHTDEAKRKISEASIRFAKSLSDERRSQIVLKTLKTKMKKYGTIYPVNTKTTWKQGWRIIADQRIYFRSRWEANYGRYLQFLKVHRIVKDWIHEPETFWFDKIKRGTCSYLPDFKVTYENGNFEYHEVKGWMDQRSITKIKRFRKYYPQFKLIIIDKKWFKNNSKKMKSFIRDWE